MPEVPDELHDACYDHSFNTLLNRSLLGDYKGVGKLTYR